MEKLWSFDQGFLCGVEWPEGVWWVGRLVLGMLLK